MAKNLNKNQRAILWGIYNGTPNDDPTVETPIVENLQRILPMRISLPSRPNLMDLGNRGYLHVTVASDPSRAIVALRLTEMGREYARHAIPVDEVRAFKRAMKVAYEKRPARTTYGKTWDEIHKQAKVPGAATYTPNQQHFEDVVKAAASICGEDGWIHTDPVIGTPLQQIALKMGYHPRTIQTRLAAMEKANDTRVLIDKSRRENRGYPILVDVDQVTLRTEKPMSETTKALVERAEALGEKAAEEGPPAVTEPFAGERAMEAVNDGEDPLVVALGEALRQAREENKVLRDRLAVSERNLQRAIGLGLSEIG